jgi:ribosomal-protein-alanine N-acetyltransferase
VSDTLQTERLLLRPFGEEHADALCAQWNDPDVGRFLWDGEPVSPETVREVIAASRGSFAARGFGLYAIALRKAPAEVVGFAGLRTVGETDEVELLYALLPAHWGRGLATEAARAVLDRAFATLPLPQIVAGADPPNAASFGVMERLGMTYHAEHESDGKAVRYYRKARP